MALYNQWGDKNAFTIALQFFMLISDSLGGVVSDTSIMLIISMISTIKWVETWYRAVKNGVWPTRFAATVQLTLLFRVYKELNAQILVCSTFTLSSSLVQWFGHFRDNVEVFFVASDLSSLWDLFRAQIEKDNNEVDPLWQIM